MTEIVVKRGPAEVARRTAELFVSAAADSIRKRGRFVVALSGGSTPGTLYRLLSGPDFRNRVEWPKVLFFFGDERNVPADSEKSNYRMAKDSLFDRLGREDLKVFRWETESAAPSGVASAYGSKIFAELGDQPVFDLVLLGLGPDGHTASLFPHSPALAENKRVAVENWVEKFNGYRLTMTFPVFNEARNVIFMVAGGDKKDAVRNVIEGRGDPKEYPARYVRPENGRLIWLLDEAAAAGLSG